MSRSRLHPRPEQVAELTRGQSLPLAPLPESILRVIAETVVRAWNELRARHRAILNIGDEAEVSALLISRLNTLRDEDPCWENIASGVSRGRETISFDGGHLEKRPDVSIHITRRNFGFPLVAECKLIDHPNKKTVNLYCKQGLTRFVNGEYAWATQEAFMLAYVRDGSSIATTLKPYLTKNQTVTPDCCATEILPTPLPHSPTDLAHSRHGRHFSYLNQESAPGSIELWHLWLSVAP